MGKHHILPALALAGGLAGFGLPPVATDFRSGSGHRTVRIRCAGVSGSVGADGGTGPGGPPAEPGWSPAEQPEHAFLCPSAGYMTLMTAAGMCFLLGRGSGGP